MAYCVANPSKEDQGDFEAALLLDFKSCNEAVSVNHYCQMLQKLYT